MKIQNISSPMFSGISACKGAKTLLAATAIMGSAVVLNAQNNKLQDKFNQFITDEFRNADTNPTDYYISADELKNYLGTESQIKLSDYDTNGDGRLNIDEFAKLALGMKKCDTPAKTSGQKTPAQATGSKAIGHSREEARAIVNSILNMKINKITEPGRLFGTNTRYEYDYDNAYKNIQRINAENLITVVNEFQKEYLSDNPNIANIYKCAVHPSRSEVTYRPEGHEDYPEYEAKVRKHLVNVMQDYATKHGLHYEKLDDTLAAARAGRVTALEEAYYLLK